MALFNKNDREVARAIGALTFTNPFLPDRIALEERILGSRFVPLQKTWSADPEMVGDNPNVAAIREIAGTLSEKARGAISAGHRAVSDEIRVYEDLALYDLYYRYEDRMYRDIVAHETRRAQGGRVPYFAEFSRDAAHFFDLPHIERDGRFAPDHLFAMLFQHRRAFHFTFRRIYGASMAVSRLRSAVWESIFTCNMRRYWEDFINRMKDMTTLITGPSGTGKELVASAIGLSRHIPFDIGSGRFAEDFRDTFHPLNLSALSPGLVESELFGHKKGSFTGAVSDRDGYLEGKGESHTVFLDEIGDVDVGIQLKLLRLLQSREFLPIGDRDFRHFDGKIIAATNRDLSTAVPEGRFRADLYYRLCSDHIVTPALSEQIADDPDELRNLVGLIAGGIVGDGASEAVAEQVSRWILEHLGGDYPWPGNIRELEQCIRSVVVHGVYYPLTIENNNDIHDRLAAEFLSAEPTADEMLDRYCTLVFARTGEYREAGRRLGLDRRTVKSRIDADLLQQLTGK